MRTASNGGNRPPHNLGFTLTEVVISLAVGVLAFSGVIYGYIRTADSAEWSAYSLAAQSLAMQGVEQARGAKWDPEAWPIVDELGNTNYTQVEVLDVPSSPGRTVWATNYVSVTLVTANPPLKQLKADCVWMLASRAKNRGPFTNTVVSLRTSDQ